MNHSTIKMTAALSSLLLLGACGADNGTEEAQPAPTVTVTETVTATPESETEEVDEDVDALEEDNSDNQTEELEVNDRGNVPMPDNAPVVVEITATGEQLAEWSAGEVITDVSCTSSYPQPPEHGAYVAIEFDVTVETEMNEYAPTGLQLSSYEFNLYDENYRQSNTMPGTHQCTGEDDTLPLETRGGSSASGLLTFDVEFDSGYLVFQDYLTGEYYEWEYSL